MMLKLNVKIFAALNVDVIYIIILMFYKIIFRSN